ncbi:MAG: hypothetical protein IJO28_08340 [Oscillospiraceae bacterium]|nr:hypothetical protein [Oscillospiraceae bacterium]
MKKLFALLLAVVMVLGMVACGGNPAPNQGGTETTVGQGGDEAATTEPTSEIVKPSTPEEIEAANAEIRYALGLLLDRNYIVESVSQAGEAPANTFVADGMADYNGGNFAKNSNDGKGYFSVDKADFQANFDEAVSILKKYYEYDGTKFTNVPTLKYLYNTNEGHKAIGEYIQSALATVGITMTMENQEWNTFLNTRKDGDFSVARNGWVADYTDPICFLDMWISGSGNNDVQYGKGAHADLKIYDLDLTPYGLDIKVEDGTWAETYDVLISEIKKCSDMEQRYAMMHYAEDILMATGCLTPVYYYTDLYMLSDKVEGFYSIPLGYKYFQGTTVDGAGDSLPICLASEPDTLDPALNSAVDGATMLVQLFAGLAKWQKNEDGSLSVVADCATELPEGVVNEDGTVTYTYTLKDGLKWSDGQALTAADFEYAWQRAASADLGADYGYMFDVIKGYGTEELAVKALDEKTLEVTLNNAVAYWNELLAFPTYFPVRKDVVENEAWATDPSTYVCNGAYTISGWEHDSVITLTKNEAYHDVANVTMNEIKCYLSDDSNNMLTNFKNGDWLLIDDVPTNEIAALKTEYPEEFVIAGQIGTYYVCWNVNENLLPQE